MSAVFPTARDRLTFPELVEEGFEPHNVREIWVMDGGPDSDLYVDVGDFMDTAVKALKAHKSQVGEEEAEKYLRQGRVNTGKKVGMEYAEAYKRITLW